MNRLWPAIFQCLYHHWMYNQLIRLTEVLDEDITPFKNLQLIGTWTTRAVDTFYYERNITAKNRSGEENRKGLMNQNPKVSGHFISSLLQLYLCPSCGNLLIWLSRFCYIYSVPSWVTYFPLFFLSYLTLHASLPITYCPANMLFGKSNLNWIRIMFGKFVAWAKQRNFDMSLCSVHNISESQGANLELKSWSKG